MMVYELRGSNAVHRILFLLFKSFFLTFFALNLFLNTFPFCNALLVLKSIYKKFAMKPYTTKLRCFYFWRPETGCAGDFTHSLPGSCAIKFNMAGNVQFLDLTPSTNADEC